MSWLALLVMTAIEYKPDPNQPMLFRVQDFVFDTDFAEHAYVPGHPVLRKVAKDGDCEVSHAPNVENRHLYVVAGINAAKGRQPVNIISFLIEGRDLLVHRLGNGYPPDANGDTEHEVVTTERGKMLVAKWSSGFFGEKAEVKLEIANDGRLLYAYAKTKTHGAHLVPFFMRDTMEAECRFE